VPIWRAGDNPLRTRAWHGKGTLAPNPRMGSRGQRKGPVAIPVPNFGGSARKEGHAQVTCPSASVLGKRERSTPTSAANEGHVAGHLDNVAEPRSLPAADWACG
jgi:hypothetical protein